MHVIYQFINKMRKKKLSWYVRLPFQPLMRIELCNHVVRTLASNLPIWVKEFLFVRAFPIVGTVCVKTEKGTMVLLGNGCHAAMEIYTYGYNGYEGLARRVARMASKNSDVIFDVGANTGIFSLDMALENDKAVIYAFEPVEQLIESHLRPNLESNGVSNVHVVSVCLQDKANLKELVFHVPGDLKATDYVPTASSILSTGTHDSFGNNTVNDLMVQCTTIDEFMASNQLKKLDFLKMDVEGFESQVLNGGMRALRNYRPVVLFESWDESNFEACRKALADIPGNYYQLIEKDHVLAPLELSQPINFGVDRNFLFVPDKATEFNDQLVELCA